MRNLVHLLVFVLFVLVVGCTVVAGLKDKFEPAPQIEVAPMNLSIDWGG